MTPKELAEKILYEIDIVMTREDKVKAIEYILTAAFNDAYRDGFDDVEKHRFRSKGGPPHHD